MKAGLFLSIAGLLLSQAAPAQVSLTAITSEGQPAPVLRAFAGETLRITLWLKGPAGESVAPTVQLFQPSQELAIPLGSVQSLGNLTFEANGGQLVEAQIPVPATDKPLSLLLRFEISAGGKGQPVGTARLEVSPKGFPLDLAELSKALKASHRRLGVFGEGNTLREFLREYKVDFVDLGATLPNQLKADTFYVGGATSSLLAAWKPRLVEEHAVTAVIFTDDDRLLPGIYSTTRGNLTCAKITLPALERLRSDPGSQATFFAALSQINASSEP